MPETIQAVLFDVDGTLLDSFEFIYGAFDYALAQHNIPARTHEEISHLMGGPLEGVYADMVPGCNSQSFADAHRQFQADNLQLVMRFPDTLDVLNALRARGIQLAAITTRSARTSVRTLEATGIANYFELILSAEDVSRVKPHPEPLLKALAALSTNPANALMVGDTRSDIEAGKNAGTPTVAALYGFGGPILRDLKPDYTIKNLTELLEIVG